MATVLLVEDDRVIAEAMAAHLDAAGFQALQAGDGSEGLDRLEHGEIDVCVLDLMLPHVDGWQVIETARGRGDRTPILVISALNTEQDRARALALGATDYLAKPFSMGELIERVRAATVQSAFDQMSPELTPFVYELFYGWP